MSVKYIKKWLAELKSLPESAHAKYCETINYNEEIVDELYNVFSNLHSEKACQLIDPVCHQLFNCYKSNVLSLHKFALEFIPAIVLSYLTLLGNSSQQSGGITAFLLGVYNLDCSDVSKSTIPNIFQKSIYHEPPCSNTLLTESALKNRQTLNEVSTPTEVPSKKFDSMTSQNRSTILAFAVKVYLSDITHMSTRSHKTLCLLCSRLSRIGFGDKIEEMNLSTEKRFSIIPEDSVERQRDFFEHPLVSELLFGMHVLMFGRHSEIALQAVHDIHFRACYDLLPEILVVTNAMLGYSKTEGIGMRRDSPKPGAAATRLKHHRPSITMETITNASFRAKKLPDDIDVQDGSEQPSHSDTSFLSDVPEETYHEPEKSTPSKVNKLQIKSLVKKDKTSKLQKAKENEPSAGNLMKKLTASIGHNTDHDGIQLKAIKQSSQDYTNNSIDVGFKPKPKSPYIGNDPRSPASFANSVVPMSSNSGAERNHDAFDEHVDVCSINNNRLSQSTFL